MTFKLMGYAALFGIVAATAAEARMPVPQQLRITPPAGYTNQWWTHPNGCEYSRAGLPGETVWYLIINTAGGKNCVPQIVQTAYPGNYPGMPRQNTIMPAASY